MDPARLRRWVVQGPAEVSRGLEEPVGRAREPGPSCGVQSPCLGRTQFTLDFQDTAGSDTRPGAVRRLEALPIVTERMTYCEGAPWRPHKSDSSIRRNCPGRGRCASIHVAEEEKDVLLDALP